MPHMYNKERNLWAETRIVYSQNQAVAQKIKTLGETNRAVFSDVNDIMNNIMQGIAAARRTLQGS